MKRWLSEDDVQTGQAQQVHKSPTGAEQWCENSVIPHQQNLISELK